MKCFKYYRVKKAAIKAEMTANLIPEVEDALLAAPMYTVPKFFLYSLHQTDIHFRSPTFIKKKLSYNSYYEK